MTGTMARPSSPSVRLTALLAPTMTKTAIGTKNQPSAISRSFMNGTARPVVPGSRANAMMTSAATAPMPICPASLPLPGRPLVLRLVSLRKSSPKPIMPKPMVTSTTTQT